MCSLTASSGTHANPCPANAAATTMSLELDTSRPRDVRMDALAAPLELPRQQPAVGRQAQAEAIVRGEILRSTGSRMAYEVVRACDHNQAHVRRYAHRDHVFGHIPAQRGPLHRSIAEYRSV